MQMHLEEVRFFDLFGYSEDAGAWQCFMCNNPEKATGECCAGGLQPGVHSNVVLHCAGVLLVVMVVAVQKES